MNNKKTVNGSITVFLSMILLIIISLVMTTVEALRVSNMNAYTQRAIYTALDSVLAEFYYPLFENYHVFGLDGAYGFDSIQEEIIEDKINSYMEYTFSPSENILFAGHNVSIKDFNLMDINTKSIKIEEKKTLMNYDGELFRSQAIGYSKYRLAGDGLEVLLEKAKIIKNSGMGDIVKAQVIMKEKAVAEEGVAIISDDLLTLGELLDGIVINKKGPKTNKEGKLAINKNFIKKICNSQTTINNPYPQNSWVSSSLKGKHIKPETIFEKSFEILDLLEGNNKIRQEAKRQYYLKSQIDISKITNMTEKIKLLREMEEAKELILILDKKEIKLVDDFNRSIYNIKNLVNSTSPLIKKSMTVIGRLIQNQSKLTKLIDSYKTVLMSNKVLISDDLYSGLWDDYLDLEKYKKDSLEEVNYYNFAGMKDTLTKNQNILQEVKEDIDIKVTIKEDSWQRGREYLSKAKDALGKYSHKYLESDYRALRKKDTESDIFDGLNSLIDNGIIELLLPDTSIISDKAIKDVDENYLPSHEYKDDDSNSDFGADNLQKLSLSNALGVFTGLLDNLKGSFNTGDFLISSLNSIGEVTLYQKYLLDHFSSFNSDSKVKMPTSLNYELEYLLYGKASDNDNLQSIVYNLLGIRTLMNTISLFTDIGCMTKAREMATILVGFLGQPILITITKTIILFAWSLAESLVDVSALLRDKAIAIYKKEKDFHIDIKDLLFINKMTIKDKVDKLKNSKSPLYMNYEDYLNIMILLKNKEIKTYRALDMIQTNLQNNYEDTFYISNCIYGIQVSGEFFMEEKFVSLPFIQKLIGLHDEGYLHNIKSEYSY